MLVAGYSMLDIAIPSVQIYLPFNEYRESSIQYQALVALKYSEAEHQRPAARNQQLQNEHRIAITVEPVGSVDGLLIGL